MVDAQVESLLIIRQSQPTACRDEAVSHALCDGLPSIGYRRIVEVAAHDDGILAVRLNKAMRST